MTDLPPSEPEPCRRWYHCTSCGKVLGYTTRSASRVVTLALYVPGGEMRTRTGVDAFPCPECGAINHWYTGEAELRRLVERVTGVTG